MINWNLILASVCGSLLVSTLSYAYGNYQGRKACENAQMAADIALASKTTSSLFKLDNTYDPIYQTIRTKPVTADCSLPTVNPDPVRLLYAKAKNRR